MPASRLRPLLLVLCLLSVQLATSARADLHPAVVTAPTPTLDRVRAVHHLNCAVVKEEEDYSRASDHGNRAAFDIDMCKAVSVAILGPEAHVVVAAFPDEPAAIKALKLGEVDIIASAGVTVPSTAAGLAFARTTLYDGQGMLFLNNPAYHSAVDFAGKKICVLTNSAAQDGIHAFAARRHISYIWYPFSEAGEMEAAFFGGNCEAVTGDVTSLANIRGIRGKLSAKYTILPEIFRQDPLAPAFLDNDARFAAIVNWTVNTLIEAEELGVTAANAEAMLKSEDPEIKTLVGDTFSTGRKLGLDDNWGANVLKATGNYGEIFDRDLGEKSPLRLDRGANKLWRDGGAMIATPLTNY